MAEENERGTSIISTQTAASLLLLSSPAELTSIARGGWIKPVAKDRWRLVEVVQGVIRYMRDRANMVTTSELLALLGISKGWMAELERQGAIKRSGKNTWPRDETVRAYIAHLRSQGRRSQNTPTAMVSMEQFGRHIGVSRERIRQLVTEGVVELSADGKIDVDRARLRYIEHLRTKPQRSPAQDMWREAKATEVKLRVAERAHELVERDVSIEVKRASRRGSMVGPLPRKFIDLLGEPVEQRIRLC